MGFSSRMGFRIWSACERLRNSQRGRRSPFITLCVTVVDFNAINFRKTEDHLCWNGAMQFEIKTSNDLTLQCILHMRAVVWFTGCIYIHKIIFISNLPCTLKTNYFLHSVGKVKDSIRKLACVIFFIKYALFCCLSKRSIMNFLRSAGYICDKSIRFVAFKSLNIIFTSTGRLHPRNINWFLRIGTLKKTVCLG